MDRAEFNSCISKGMAGKKFSKGERKIEFCTLAKLCSGKSKSRDEALEICRQPKAATVDKPTKAKGSRKKFNPGDLAICIIDHGADLTLSSLSAVIAECQEAKKPYSKTQFIRDCIKQDAILGSLSETVKLKKQCEIKWKENNPDVQDG